MNLPNLCIFPLDGKTMGRISFAGGENRDLRNPPLKVLDRLDLIQRKLRSSTPLCYPPAFGLTLQQLGWSCPDVL